MAYLERYPVVRSGDSEFARDRLFTIFGADGFDTHGKFGMRSNYALLTSIGIGFCEYDAAVSLSFPEADFVRQFFSIQGSANFTTTSMSAAIGAWSPLISGESRLVLDFAAAYRQLVVRIDAGALERSLKDLLGDAGDRKLVFRGDDPDPVRMSLLRRDIFRCAEEIEWFGLDYSPIALAEFERSLIMRFLLAHRHNFTHRLQREPASANRGLVDTIESFIEANWDKPIDVGELARLVNASVRTVFREFARAGRGSPGQFARRVRLQSAAELLRHPGEHTSVIGVAMKCGFQHPGRFASDYALLIGELPSETLKRARTRR